MAWIRVIRQCVLHDSGVLANLLHYYFPRRDQECVVQTTYINVYLESCFPTPDLFK